MLHPFLAICLAVAPAPKPPPPILRLPSPPEIASSPVGSETSNARIENTLRLQPFLPWLLGGVGTARRFTEPSKFGLLADLRLALPLSVYGSGRLGGGIAPTLSVAAMGGLPDHFSAGAALGIFEERRDKSAPASGFVLIGEGLLPFSKEGGVKPGFSLSLLFMARGPWLRLGYNRFPAEPEPMHGLTLSVGLNFTEAFL